MRLLAVLLWNWIWNWTIVVVGHGSLELKVLRVELRMGVLVVKVSWLLTMNLFFDVIDHLILAANRLVWNVIRVVLHYRRVCQPSDALLFNMGFLEFRLLNRVGHWHFFFEGIHLRRATFVLMGVELVLSVRDHSVRFLLVPLRLSLDLVENRVELLKLVVVGLE